MCLWCAARWELAGLLLLHLSWVAGPEGGVPRNVGWDHQWPDTKGGVGPYSHYLLPQEVTRCKAGTEVALRTGKERRKRGSGKGTCSRKAWSVGPSPCHPLRRRPRLGSQSSRVVRRRIWSWSRHKHLRAVNSLRHQARHAEIDFWQTWRKHPDVHPCNPAPKMKTVFCGDKAIHHLEYIHAGIDGKLTHLHAFP